MTFTQRHPFGKPVRIFGCALLTLCLVAHGLSDAGGKRSRTKYSTAALNKNVPQDIEDLKAIQDQVKRVLKKVLPCTVSVQVGMAHGSGVIIRKGGYILTAAHVSGKARQNATVILADGRTVKGKTLGANQTIDSGLIKIIDKGKWPFVKMGDSAHVKKGEWCISVGHPGGYKTGRTPVVRLGRLLEVSKSYLCTDCTLVGGDSGGPVFDLNGKVIGIHSCIGNKITSNIHIPVNTYRKTWERLVKGEVWGKRPVRRSFSRPYFGVEGESEDAECKIHRIEPGSPADLAGLKENDVVLKFNGRGVGSFSDLSDEIGKTKPGDRVQLEVRRGREFLTVEVEVGKTEE